MILSPALGCGRRALPLLLLGALSACSGGGAGGGGGGGGGDRDSGRGDTDSGGGGQDTADEDTQVGPPPGERLWIAYTREATVPSPSLPEGVQLIITDEDCERGDCPTEIVVAGSDPAFTCDNGCQVTPDLSYVVFFDGTEPRTLRYAPLDSGFQLAANSSVLATGVDGYQVQQHTVAYQTGDDIFTFDMSSGDQHAIANTTSTGGTGGGFYLAPDAATIFISRVTLTTMTVSRAPVTGGTEITVYRFISGEEQGTGSFYSGREQAALSADGQVLALLTDARVSANECGTDADCDAPEWTCLDSAQPRRCVAQKLVLNLLNLDALDQLGNACRADADCGAHHECDLSAPDPDTGEGACIPGAIPLGPSGPRACDFLALGEYSRLRPRVEWRDANSVLLLATQDCIRQNIEVTDVVAVDIHSGAVTRLYENPGQPHGNPECYSALEDDYVPELCHVEIEQIGVSPSGGSVVFVADSPQSPTKHEVWLLDAYGRRSRELLTQSIDFEVLSVSAHSR